MRTQEQILQGENLDTFLMKCSMDFKLWCNRVIQDPVDHTKGLSIQPFHMEWFNSVHTKPRSCIRAPREHGKTLLLGAAYPLWVVFFNQFKEILIVSNTLEQSTKVLEVVKETIRQNQLLDKLIPVDKDATWSKTEIHTSTRCKIFCKPNNDNIRGSHVDYVICDEPATYRDKDIFWRVITPTVQIKKGNICVIGTPESEYDLLADIMKNPAYNSKTYKAEYIEKGVRKVLWPEKFTLDRLEKLKEEIGIDGYKKEYLCDPIPDKTQVFQSKWIHEATNYGIGFSQPEDGGLYYIGADFAMSRGKKADYSVFCLVERTKDNKIIIRHMERYKGLPHKTQEQKIIGMWKKWSAKRVNLDESTFGRIITDNLRLDGLPVIGTTFSPVERHQLLAYLQNQFEKNRIVIPRKPGGLTTYLTGVLMEELSKFGYFTNRRTGTTSFKSFGTHDDTVIALALAVKVAGESKRILTHVATSYSVSKKAFKNKDGIIHIDTRIRDN